MSRIEAMTSICMIIGDPVSQSLSPRMHNAAYSAVGLDSTFVFVAATVRKEDLGCAMEGVRALGIRGVSCTMPHKQSVMPLLDEIDQLAQSIGAVNTVVNDAGKLRGYNTDWIGVTAPLLSKVDLAGKSAALIGAGGAARAAAFGLTRYGASVTIFNRTRDRAKALAEEVGGTAFSMEDISRATEADIVVHATPSGMRPNVGESVLGKNQIRRDQIIFDTVYSPHETSLIKNARAAGATVIHGMEMLLHQGVAQFELYTGKKAPIDAMRAALWGGIRGEER